MAIVALTAIAAIGLYHTWVRLGSSADEVVAVVYERRMLGPGEQQASATDKIASEILSPACIRNAILAGASDESQRAAAPLSELVERWRKELRVDIEPGEERRPWSIFIRVGSSTSPQAAQIANAVAEQYCRSRRAAAAAEQRQSLRQAQTEAAKAQKTSAAIRSQLESQIDALRQAAGSMAAASPARGEDNVHGEQQSVQRAELAQRREELAASITELEARKAALLERLMPAHPDVRAIDGEIAAARGSLERLPPDEPSPDDGFPALPEPPLAAGELPPDAAKKLAESLEEIHKLRRALSHAEANLERAELAERRAWQRIVEVDLSQVASMKPAIAAAPRPLANEWPLALLSGAVGALVAWLLGARGGSDADTFGDAEELEETLGFPVVGILSADDQSMTHSLEAASHAETRRAAS